MSQPSRESTPGLDVLPEPICVRMLEDETLKNFWEFATTVRRTKSLADTQSAKLRGTWLSPELAVQRIHGWGLRSVRLLCVSASSEEQCQRLTFFFQRDRRNLEGRLIHSADPLDREQRVLVKIPFDAGCDAWVAHEQRVLTELAGLEGVPKLDTPLYFEDIGVHAATYEYCDATSIQEQLEQGRLMPPESTHSIVSSMLTTLKSAHDLGWLHTDLTAKDVLLPGREGSKSRSPGLVCGWSRAVSCSDAIVPSPDIVAFARALPVQGGASVDAVVDAPEELAQDSGGAEEAASGVPVTDQLAVAESLDFNEAITAGEASSPSIYSAPEQFIALFAGLPCVTASTDIYRAAGIALMATCANAPFGVQGKAISRAAAPDMSALRRLCKQTILRRSEAEEGQKDALPTADEVNSLSACLLRLLSGQANLSRCKAAEVVPWFQKALSREAGERFQTADEALEALDAAWSEYEERLTKEFRAAQLESENMPPPKEEEKRQRLVFEPPPELLEMTVL